MNAQELAAILDVLRARGVSSAEVPLSFMSGAPCLRVVFEPGGPLPAGDETTPGGWKSPQRLDSDPLDDERSVP